MTEAIPYDWARVECPTCLAGVNLRCRALTTGRVTDTHTARIEAAWRWRIDG